METSGLDFYVRSRSIFPSISSCYVQSFIKFCESGLHFQEEIYLNKESYADVDFTEGWGLLFTEIQSGQITHDKFVKYR